MRHFNFVDWVMISFIASLMAPIVTALPYIFIFGATTPEGEYLPPDPTVGTVFVFFILSLNWIFDKYCEWRKPQ